MMSLYTQMRNAAAKDEAAQTKSAEEFTMESILDGPVKRPASSRLYKSPAEKYADARSTSSTFFVVGGIGLAAMLLSIAGVLELPVHGFGLYSMSAFFLIFIIIGLFYRRVSGKFLTAIEAERARVQTITEWYETEGAQTETLQELLKAGPGDEPEAFYLQKYALLQQLLRERFPDEDEALLDKLASDFSEEERIDAMLVEDVRLEAVLRERMKK